MFFPWPRDRCNAPPYPNSDPTNYLDLGTTDADTDSGTGVTDWQRRVDEITGFANPPVSGVMTAAWVAVVDDLQRTVGVTADGSLGPQTWNATLRPRQSPPTPRRSSPAGCRWCRSRGRTSTCTPRRRPARRSTPSGTGVNVPRDIAIDLGPGKTKAQGRKLLRPLLAKYGEAARYGTIVFRFDPNETDRTRPLAPVEHQGARLGGSRTSPFQVSSKVVELDTGERGRPDLRRDLPRRRAPRDAMFVEDLLEQRRSAQPDPSRRPGTSGEGLAAGAGPADAVGLREPVRGAATPRRQRCQRPAVGVTVPFAEVGKLAGIRLTSTRPFAMMICASCG